MEFLNTIGGYALGILGAGLAAFMAGIGSAAPRVCTASLSGSSRSTSSFPA